MARWTPSLLLVPLLWGCQQQVVSQLPRPNLDGPVVLQPSPARASPQAQQPPAPGSAAARPRIPGVPEEWIPDMPPNRWQWIIIHHSATPGGSAAFFDRVHRQKGWDELGYHFVIGNGTGSPDGKVEVGSRWKKQKWGAHAKTADNRYNDYGIGICLVGNFEIDRPTPAQLQSLTRLLAFLMRTYHIPPSRVLGHNECKPTDCPGRYLRVAEVRKAVTGLAVKESEDWLAAAAKTAASEAQSTR